MSQNHTVIILAAGEGLRLRPHTNDVPKCLLKVGNKRLIEHIVDSCEEAGIKDIVVVIGYKGEKVKKVLGNHVRYITNKKYASTQTMYSLYAARKAVRGKPIIHMNGDTYFHPLILKKLLDHPHQDAMVVDFGAKLDEEATKAIVQGQRVRIIGKDIPIKIASGECLGIRKYSAASASRLFEKLEKAVRKGQTNKYIFEIIKECFKTQRFDAVSTENLPWTEVDFEKDLKKANDLESKPTVLIFAAGVGRRIWPLTTDAPKALLKVGGKTLIERQIEIFRGLGLNDIVVIVGHRKNMVKKLLGNSVRYAENPFYRSTQTMYSLWQARKLARGKAIIIVMGDLLISEKLVSKLIFSKKRDCCIVDFDIHLNDDTIKAAVNDGKIITIHKRVPPSERLGEYIGFNKISDKGSKILFELCEEILRNSNSWKSAHIPLIEFATKRPLYAVSAKGAEWVEIDIKHDYLRAKKISRKMSAKP